MLTRILVIVAVVATAAAGAAGIAYVSQRDRALRAEGEVKVWKELADSTARAARADAATTRARDSVTAEVARREEAARAAAGAAAARAGARAGAAADSIRAAAVRSDSVAVRDKLAELTALYEERDQARLEQLRADAVIIEDLRARDVTRLAAISSLEAALAASEKRAEAAEAARPGWAERNAPKVAVPVAFILGLIVHDTLD